LDDFADEGSADGRESGIGHVFFKFGSAFFHPQNGGGDRPDPPRGSTAPFGSSPPSLNSDLPT
jgi:hypothetical protein